MLNPLDLSVFLVKRGEERYLAQGLGCGFPEISRVRPRHGAGRGGSPQRELANDDRFTISLSPNLPSEIWK